MDVLLAILIIGWAIFSKVKGKNKGKGRNSFFEKLFKAPGVKNAVKADNTAVHTDGINDFSSAVVTEAVGIKTGEEECPYEEDRFHQEFHSCAYEQADENRGLNTLEQGIILSEILSKPVSMRKR